MHYDYDTETNGAPIWYDGQSLRQDPVDATGRRVLNEKQTKENGKFY